MNGSSDKNSHSNANPPGNKTKQVALTGMLFATALVLSLVEGMLAPLPIPVPGVKIGLANIVVMYALFLINAHTAALLAVLKAGFVCLIRGPISGILSLSGGVMSVLAMMAMLCIVKDGSYLLVSVIGAVFHNVGQYAAVCILYSAMGLWIYLPVLILSGIASGIVTAALLKLVLPAIQSRNPRA